MNKECAEIFYLHAPDPDVPVEETLAEVRSFVRSCVRSCTLLARASMAATDQALSWLADALGWSGAAQVQKLYAEGKFQQLGLSNYQSWEVVHIYHHMLSNGWVLPTIYQVKVRSHCRFRNKCTDSLSESGIKWMRAVVQSGNAGAVRAVQGYDATRNSQRQTVQHTGTAHAGQIAHVIAGGGRQRGTAYTTSMRQA